MQNIADQNRLELLGAIKAFSIPTIGTLLFILVFFVVGVFEFNVLGRGNIFQLFEQGVWLTTFCILLQMVLEVIVIKPNLNFLRMLGFVSIKSWKTAIISVLALLFLVVLLELFQHFFHFSTDQTLVEMLKAGKLNFLLFAIFAIIIQPIWEETVFRGWLMGSLTNKLGVFSIILSSLIFAIIHLNYFDWNVASYSSVEDYLNNGIYYFQFFSLFLLGLGLSITYWKTRSLWPGIIFHVLNNSTGVWLINNEKILVIDFGGDEIGDWFVGLVLYFSNFQSGFYRLYKFAILNLESVFSMGSVYLFFFTGKARVWKSYF